MSNNKDKNMQEQQKYEVAPIAEPVSSNISNVEENTIQNDT